MLLIEQRFSKRPSVWRTTSRFSVTWLQRKWKKWKKYISSNRQGQRSNSRSMSNKGQRSRSFGNFHYFVCYRCDMVDLWKRLKSSIFNRFFSKLTHMLLGPIRWNVQKNWTDPKNVTYVSMAKNIPIIKHREFFHISMCYISAINEHISSKCAPVMHRNMVNSQKSNYLEISRSTSNT